MKKFNRIVVFVLLLVCLFSLAACAEDGYYVKGSLQYQYSYGEVSTTIEVKLPAEGEYEISYTLEYYYNGTKFDSQKHKTIKSVTEAKTISLINELEVKNVSVANSSGIEVYIKNASVRKSNPRDNFAIAFGVTGGALLIGAVVLFVVLKKRESK